AFLLRLQRIDTAFFRLLIGSLFLANIQNKGSATDAEFPKPQLSRNRGFVCIRIFEWVNRKFIYSSQSHIKAARLCSGIGRHAVTGDPGGRPRCCRPVDLRIPRWISEFQRQVVDEVGAADGGGDEQQCRSPEVGRAGPQGRRIDEAEIDGVELPALGRRLEHGSRSRLDRLGQDTVRNRPNGGLPRGGPSRGGLPRGDPVQGTRSRVGPFRCPARCRLGGGVEGARNRQGSL